MEFWLFLPQIALSAAAVVERAQAAERSGFSGIAFMDHLVAPNAAGRDVWEAMTLATWVAAHTTTLRIGHLVLCEAFRSPAVLAKQVATLDHLSGGRFELGLGSGSWPSELADYSVGPASPTARVDQLSDTLETLARLLGPGSDLTPLPTRQVPLVIGATGPRMRRLAAEHADWWNLQAPDVHRLEELRGSIAPARISVQQAFALVPPGGDATVVEERMRRRLPGFGEGLLVGSAVDAIQRVSALSALGVERTYVWLAAGGAVADIEEFGRAVLRPGREAA